MDIVVAKLAARKHFGYVVRIVRNAHVLEEQEIGFCV